MPTDETVHTLANNQVETYNLIKQEYENFKKYGPARRHIKYVEEKLAMIQLLWGRFQTINGKIIELASEDDQNHEYFTKKFLANARRGYEQVVEAMQTDLQRLQKAEESSQIGVPSGSIENSNDIGLELPNSKDQPGGLEASTSIFDISLKDEVQSRRYKAQLNRAAAIQRLDASVKNTFAPTKQTLNHNLQKLQNYWMSFVKGDDEIAAYRSVEDDDESYHINGIFFTTERYYDSTVELIQHKLQNLTATPVSNVLAHNEPPLTIRLPEIDIPKFGGDLAAWPTFRELFTKIIMQRAGLLDSQKLQYLKAYLTGNALNVIKHLEILDDNLEVAWKLIFDRYNNERLLLNKQYETLFGQQAVGDDVSSGLRRICDTSRECIYSLEKMGINILAADSIVVFHIYNKLDKDTIIAYEQSLKNPDKVQKLTELLSFIEQRFRTLDTIKQKNGPIKRHHQNVYASHSDVL